MGQHVLVVSPHFDDAALSLGGVIARRSRDGDDVLVPTVCGGVPSDDPPASKWDRRCGFLSGVQAATTRRGEDQAGCAILGATPMHLPALDGPYRVLPLQEVIASLLRTASRFEAIYIPAGLGGNPDHLAVRDECLRILADQGSATWLYADLPYASDSPDWGSAGYDPVADDRWSSDLADVLRTCEIVTQTTERVAPDMWDIKRKAIFSHSSQLSALATKYRYFLEHPGPLQLEWWGELRWR